MAMGSLSDGEDDFNPEINTTPLVDVMLVLLIIFIITIPVINHAVKIDLPRASNAPQELKPDNIDLTVNAAGQVYWDGEPVEQEELAKRVALAANREPQPALHMHVERSAQFEQVAQIMAIAQAGGLARIGFITEPTGK